MRATGPDVEFCPELQLVILLRLCSPLGVNISTVNGLIWTYVRGDEGGVDLN